MKDIVIEIPQTISGITSILDIASPLFERYIIFENDAQYAVVLPSYYNHDVETFLHLDDAVELYEELTNQGFLGVVIMDRTGEEFQDVR
jgi:hypothetical protein